MASRPMAKRIGRELEALRTNPPDGVRLVSADGSVWRLEVTGAAGTVFDGERYTLKVDLGSRYPYDSPEVVFEGESPKHPHIYENGHICLSILDKEWSPALSVASVCISILSMLSSCKQKERPSDNDSYMLRWRVRRQGPKQTSWAFHDDTV